ncbi:hypothetical protein AVEN_2862-1 [Araneus ventricosus]|uniref:Uncharacterized protein n=1 Tax=Araneus ventricosus TaxID=182803 RepID=A0A4Y2DSV4_ARAVE|nr:hypothetical protein AVEN_2862-1 [Araneus ventricosus]
MSASDNRLSAHRRHWRNAASSGTLSGVGIDGRPLEDCSTTTLALMRRCVHSRFCSGSSGRCLIIPPIVPIWLRTTSICSSTCKGSWRSSISRVTTTCRQMAVHRLSPLSGGPAAEFFDTGIQKLVSLYDAYLNSYF